MIVCVFRVIRILHIAMVIPAGLANSVQQASMATALAVNRVQIASMVRLRRVLELKARQIVLATLGSKPFIPGVNYVLLENFTLQMEHVPGAKPIATRPLGQRLVTVMLDLFHQPRRDIVQLVLRARIKARQETGSAKNAHNTRFLFLALLFACVMPGTNFWVMIVMHALKASTKLVATIHIVSTACHRWVPPMSVALQKPHVSACLDGLKSTRSQM